MTQAKAIPDGYHTMTPMLTIRNSAKAVEFYKKALNAQELYRMDGPDGTLMHAEMKIGNSIFMLGEENLEMGNRSPQTLNGTATALYLYVQDPDAAFNQAVSAGAQVGMPVADMFWGDRVGQVTDPFGHRWWFATHKEDVTPEQMTQRAKEMFASKASKP